MSNRAFWRALHSLAHPLTIGAVALALLNDHVLRQHWPSWWTGKLSDFAWLVFAPFLLAALLAWLIPSRIRRQEALVGVLAFALTGAGFALAKMIPLFHSIAVAILELLTGWKSGLRLDPTDLIALPALLVGWYVWQHAGHEQLRLRPHGWVMLALGALATLANSPGNVDFGINCLIESGSSILAVSERAYDYIVYVSGDGGLSWQEASTPLAEWPDCAGWRGGNKWQITDPWRPNVQYRFRPSEGIDRSEDNGQTWFQEIGLSEIGSEARETYFQLSNPGSIMRAGPLDAITDPINANLIVAMGQEGVLVRSTDGRWQWVQVGPYSQRTFDKAQFLQVLVSGELSLAGLLIILLLSTIIQPVRNDIKCLEMSALALAWLTWGCGVLFFGPAYRQDSLLNWSVGIILATCVLSGGSLAIMDVLNVFYEKRTALLPMFGISFVTAFLFLLPYALWTQGNIPHHSTATLFAITLTATAIFAGQQYMKRLFHGKPLTRKRKKVDEADNLNLIESSEGGDE